jgi:hypothetical protein
LACHQFQRIHGEFPQSLEQLVPRYLDAIPIDSMHRDGGAIQYRKQDDGEALVWSLGYNEVDDGGDVGHDRPDFGYRIRLKRTIDAKQNSAAESDRR